MRPDDRLSEWMDARRTADVPPGFTDRIMTAAARRDTPAATDRDTPAATDHDMTAAAKRDMTAAAKRRRDRALHVVVVALAGVLGAARIAAALAVFFPQ
ncbi:MAG: hypothetical protein K8T90_15710 [Planctomycetes bacterium]|nr:hypothetical protein [Planctomycetota bacterium]